LPLEKALQMRHVEGQHRGLNCCIRKPFLPVVPTATVGGRHGTNKIAIPAKSNPRSLKPWAERRMPLVQESVEQVCRIDVDQYKYGFETLIEIGKGPKGLSEELPMEYAAEVQKLISVSLQGSVG
jgi:hypothetical protein